jgi:hypothetical protein
MLQKFFITICIAFIFTRVCFSQTPANDGHWQQKWDDEFKNLTISNGTWNNWIGGSSEQNCNWQVLNNFDHAGEPQVYTNAQTAIVTTGTEQGIHLTVEKQDYNCTGCIIDGGIYYSTTAGSYNNWTAINASPLNQYVTAIAVNSSGYVFAGTDGGGVYYSTNGTNNTWNAVNASPLNQRITAIAINNSGNVFVGTNGGGVYYSTNGTNNTWNAVNASPLNQYITSIAINSSGNVFVGTDGGGVYYSTNGTNNTWNAVNASPLNQHITSLAINSSNYVFAGTRGGGVYYSTNGTNNSWYAVNASPLNQYITSLAINSSNYIFAGTQEGGVYYSTNGTNNTWNAVNASPLNQYITSLAINSSNYVFVGTSGGVYYSTNGTNNTWNAVNASPLKLNIHALAISGSNLFSGSTSGAAYPYHHYVSGGIGSNGDTNLTTGRMVRYGYIEAKIKYPDTYGLWSGFWLWNCGRDGGGSYSNWCDYDNDEIDIQELIPGKTIGEPCSQYYNRQGDKYIFSSGIPTSQALITPCTPDDRIQLNYVNDYTIPHKYGLEWTPSKIIWYIDDQVVRNSPNPGYPTTDPYGKISQAMHIELLSQISSYVNWEIDNPDRYYVASYNNRSDYSNYFDTSYPDVPNGASVNRATTYSSSPINGPVNLNTASPDMYIEYVKYWQLDESDCSTIDLTITTNNLTAADTKVKKSITTSDSNGAISLPSSKIWRASNYILINGDFDSNGQELYLDANPCNPF